MRAQPLGRLLGAEVGLAVDREHLVALLDARARRLRIAPDLSDHVVLVEAAERVLDHILRVSSLQIFCDIFPS